MPALATRAWWTPPLGRRWNKSSSGRALLRPLRPRPAWEGDGDPGEEEEKEQAGSIPSSGVVWHVKIMTDDYDNPQHCLESGGIKPRRPLPMVRASDFISGLVQADGRWIFPGPLNGWPGLQGLELSSLTVKRSKYGAKRIKRLWNASDGTKPPAAGDLPRRTRATMVAPVWREVGWAPDSPGFVWWYRQQHCGGPAQLLHGEGMLQVLGAEPHAAAHAVKVHAYAHRYVVKSETLRDQQTWHTVLLVEWSHGLFTTLVEKAWRDGIGGCGGRSNWCEDKLASPTALLEAMPSSMVVPYDTKRAELRLIDMPARSREDFEAYLHKYSPAGDLPAAEQRFLAPKVYASGDVRLRRCCPAELAGYLLNYSHSLPGYHELTQNCQTFVADLYGFLTGSKDSQPFGNIIKPVYKRRAGLFLYSPLR